MRKGTGCCVGAMAVLWTVGLAKAQTSLTHLIVNRSFEDPAFTRTAPDQLLFTHRPNEGPGAVPGWTTPNLLMGIVELTGTADPVNDFPPGADEGKNALWMNAAAEAVQTLPQVIVAGDTYTLTLAVGTRQSFPANHYRAELLADGVPVAADDNSLAPLPTPATWQNTTVVYTAPSADAGKRLGIRLSVPVADGVQTLFDDLQLTTSGSEVVELIKNNDFTLPPLADGPFCGKAKDEGPISDWLESESGNVLRNADTCYPEGDACPQDGSWLAIQQNGYAYQVIPNNLLAANTDYRVRGLWQLWNVWDEANLTASIEVRIGANPTGGTVLGSVSESFNRPPNDDCNNEIWPAFCFGFRTPTTLGADPIVVVIRSQASACCLHGLRVDWISMSQGSATCHDLASITPEYGVRGDVVSATITGEGFVPGSTSVKLVQSASVINGAVTSVSAGIIQAEFDLTGAAAGDYSVVVTVDGAEATMIEAFTVILPALSNGSFDADNVGECTPSPTVPMDWQAVESSGWGWGRRLNLNGFYEDGGVPGDLPFTPSCLQDGPNYANMATDKNRSNAYSYAYQTIAVTPASEYTFSGLFAVSGDLQVSIDLINGMPDFTATPMGLIGREIINSGDAEFDWRFARVSATPTLDHMTVMWRSNDLGTVEQIKASFADGLALEVCESVPPTITDGSVTPGMGLNTGTVNITNISGTAFAGTPIVLLNRPGASVTATNVNVVGPNKIECQFDLTGLPTGWYDLIVKQGGCIAEEPEQFLVVGTELVNGSFEEPTAPQECGPPPIILPGVPTGWSYLNKVPERDHNVYFPTCPNPTDGGHYASMTGGSGEVSCIYQVLQVQPLQEYEFGGEFAAGGNPSARIVMLDGTISGGAINPDDVLAEAALTDGDWQAVSIVGAATGNVMTVVWEVQASTETYGVHADGMYLIPIGVPCSDPFADADNDGDVDQDDFGRLQICITGVGGTIPDPDDETDPLAYCRCFDRNFDTDITQNDVTAFEDCASGPMIAADPACDD